MTTLPKLEETYCLDGELGQGGFGMVHRALSLDDGSPVAVKVSFDRLDPEDRERILREARLAQDLDHPNLCRFLGALEDAEGRLVLAYELVEGEALDEAMRRRLPDAATALDWVRQIAAGLKAIHEVGLVYRDLKPENTMLQPDGRLRLLDFGLLKPEVPGETLTKTGEIWATPEYAAPELFRGQRATQASDLYSFGCLAYALVEGRPPFTGELTEVAMAHMNDQPPAPVRLDEVDAFAMARFVQTALAKDPEGRYASAEALAEGLVRALGAAPATAAGGATRPVRRPDASTAEVLDHSEVTLSTPSRPFSSVAHEEPRSVPEIPRKVWLGGAFAILALVSALLPGGETSVAGPDVTTAPPTPAPAPEGGLDWGALPGQIERAFVDGLTAPPDPLDAPARVAEIGPVREFLAWIGEGGAPHRLPEGDRRAALRAGELLEDRGFTSPFHAFLLDRPEPDPVPVPPLLEKLPPPPPTAGWLPVAATLRQEVVARTAERDAELAESPRGPYPGGVSLPVGGQFLALQGVSVEAFLPLAAKNVEGRRALRDWMYAPELLVRRLVRASVRALEEVPEDQAADRFQLLGRWGRTYRGWLLGPLATTPPELLVGAPLPEGPAASAWLAFFMEEQENAAKILRGSATPSRTLVQLWTRALALEGEGEGARFLRASAWRGRLEALLALDGPDPVRALVASVTHEWEAFTERDRGKIREVLDRAGAPLPDPSP